MDDKEFIKNEMINEINRETARLENIAKEKEKLPVMAKIVILSCGLMIKADGKTTSKEIFDMERTVFKHFCINFNVVNKYFHTLFMDVNLTSLKEDIEQYKIDKDFLRNVFKEIMKSKGLRDFTSAEFEALGKIVRIFDIPDVLEPHYPPPEDDIGEDDSYDHKYYFDHDAEKNYDNDSESLAKIEGIEKESS